VSVPFWVAEMADLFWSSAGMVEPFPRSLRRPIVRASRLAVVLLPLLRIANVREWLRRIDIACPCTERDRALRACLVARAGSGVAFIDSSDSETEQRFSLAHELAHFLRHYWHPRRKASLRLGERVGEVFDGLRPPTQREELRSLLADIPLGFHMHLMGRDGSGRVLTEAVAVAEAEADRLAFELLAPAASVLSSAGDGGPVGLLRRLQSDYGLPPAQAREYAQILMPSPTVDPLLTRLGFGA
jgi:hypothetical protein